MKVEIIIKPDILQSLRKKAEDSCGFNIVVPENLVIDTNILPDKFVCELMAVVVSTYCTCKIIEQCRK